jgi:hypothetical protein
VLPELWRVVQSASAAVGSTRAGETAVGDKDAASHSGADDVASTRSSLLAAIDVGAMPGRPNSKRNFRTPSS